MSRPPHRRRFFRVRLVMARKAQTYQVIIVPRKLRVLVHLFDVVDYLCFPGSSVPPAPNALIMITPFDVLAFLLPAI